MRKQWAVIVLISFFSLSSGGIYASDGAREGSNFSIRDLIFSHLLDSHEWHIAEFQGHHITIPLPVIVYHDGSLSVFLSSRLSEGDYKGFRLQKEGGLEKGLVCIDSQGAVDPRKPIDLSITKNVLSLMLVSLLIFVIFRSVAKSYARRENRAPKGLQALMEPLILYVRDEIVRPALGQNSDRFLPYLLTLFFFILLNNLFGMIPFFPGGANVTGNISVTLVLAFITFIITNVSAKKAYWVDIFNNPEAPWWIKIPLPLLPVVEFIGVFTKPFVLMIRLFANITAGHVIILGLVSVIFILGQIIGNIAYATSIFSIAFSLFISALELIVSFVQALVFTLLTALYIGMATSDHTKHSTEVKS